MNAWRVDTSLRRVAACIALCCLVSMPAGADEAPDDLGPLEFEEDCVCIPRNHGFWHRYCLGTDTIDPGRRGKGEGPGSQIPAASAFPPDLTDRVDAQMARYGVEGCQALDEGSFSDKKNAALREMAVMHFNDFDIAIVTHDFGGHA